MRRMTDAEPERVVKDEKVDVRVLRHDNLFYLAITTNG
jgi:hypothetical protein